jgi:hypothetical protein
LKDHGIKVSCDQEAEKCRKQGDFGPCSKLGPRYKSTVLTWDKTESIQSMDQQNKLFEPPRRLKSLEQLEACISSRTRLFVSQAT